MESFKIIGKKGYLLVNFIEVYGFPDSTSFAGGYDVKGSIEINSGSYSACGELWFSTGEIYNFLSRLVKCHKELTGTVEFLTTEANLKMLVDFDKFGHVIISGEYVERYDENNKLIFEIFSDKSYLQETINDLTKITKKYGGLKGLIK